MLSTYSKIDKDVLPTEIQLPTSFILRVKSLINKLKSIGDKIQPCLSPQLTSNQSANIHL